MKSLNLTTLKVNDSIELSQSFSGDFAKSGEVYTIVRVQENYIQEEIVHCFDVDGMGYHKGQKVNITVYWIKGKDGQEYPVWPEETKEEISRHIKNFENRFYKMLVKAKGTK